MRILLTGATGLIGPYIISALRQAGHTVVAFVRPTSNRDRLSGLEVKEGDLLDPFSLSDALEGVDAVVHAAAMVSFQSGDRERMERINGEGTANVVNAMLASDVSRLVHISSVAVLNRIDGGDPVCEADRWPEERPNSSYALSKFAAEREIWRGQAEGLSVAALYPSVVLGVGDWDGGNTPAIWKRIYAGQRFYPRGSTGFVAAEDVARAVAAVVERGIDGDRFLLNAANLSWKDFLVRVASSLGVDPPRVGLSRWQSSLLWPAEALRVKITGARALITRESHRNVQSKFRYDGGSYVRETGNPYTDIATVIETVSTAFLREYGTVT